MHLALISKKKLHARILDAAYILFVRREIVDNRLNAEYVILKNRNDYNKERYNELIEEQNFMKQYGYEQIEKMQSKQNEIKKYLESLNYKEDENMYEY